MSIPAEKLNEIEQIIKELFKHIVFENVSERAPLGGYLSLEEPFAVDYEGFYGPYQSLRRSIVSIEKLGEQWSDEALKEKIFNLLVQLAELKKTETSPNYEELTLNWINGIDVEFEEQECYVPVIGLNVLKSLQLGDVRFAPLEELKEKLLSFDETFFDKLVPGRDSLAITRVTAEWQKSAEVAREKVEETLNILRFIGSLVWWDRPVGHIYVAGKELRRVSYTLVIESKTEQLTGIVGHTLSTPAPFKIDDEFLRFAEFYGLSYIQSLINQNVSPIEDDLLAAIQWFGYATQESEALVSFVKFYIAIETALKKDKENAKNFLPERTSILLEPSNKSRQEKLQQDFTELINERNAVFHQGRPIKFSPEYLSDAGLILARQILHQLRLRIKSDNIQSKDELIAWTKEQLNKINS